MKSNHTREMKETERIVFKRKRRPRITSTSIFLMRRRLQRRYKRVTTSKDYSELTQTTDIEHSLAPMALMLMS
jgi:hypothetical protein